MLVACSFASAVANDLLLLVSHISIHRHSSFPSFPPLCLSPFIHPFLPPSLPPFSHTTALLHFSILLPSLHSLLPSFFHFSSFLSAWSSFPPFLHPSLPSFFHPVINSFPPSLPASPLLSSPSFIPSSLPPSPFLLIFFNLLFPFFSHRPLSFSPSLPLLIPSFLSILLSILLSFIQTVIHWLTNH